MGVAARTLRYSAMVVERGDDRRRVELGRAALGVLEAVERPFRLNDDLQRHARLALAGGVVRDHLLERADGAPLERTDDPVGALAVADAVGRVGTKPAACGWVVGRRAAAEGKQRRAAGIAQGLDEAHDAVACDVELAATGRRQLLQFVPGRLAGEPGILRRQQRVLGDRVVERRVRVEIVLLQRPPARHP